MQRRIKSSNSLPRSFSELFLGNYPLLGSEPECKSLAAVLVVVRRLHVVLVSKRSRSVPYLSSDAISQKIVSRRLERGFEVKPSASAGRLPSQ
jgi:hypothetical protein